MVNRSWMAAALVTLVACGGGAAPALVGNPPPDGGRDVGPVQDDGGGDAQQGDAVAAPDAPLEATAQDGGVAEAGAQDAGSTCDPSTCSWGCCTSSGACLVFANAQQSSAACGSQGQACQTCPPVDAGFACGMVVKYGVGAPGNVVGGWCCEPNGTTCIP